MAPDKDTVNTVCAYCGVGCGLVLHVTADAESDRRHIAESVGNKEHPANFGRLCTKGATTADLLAAPGRMETAHLRADRGEPLEPIDMDAAIVQCAKQLRAIIDEHGPDSFAMYVSGQMSLEAQYLANKLTKGFIGTNQIESNSRLCMASAGSGYKLSLGADGPPGSYQDFDHADVFFLIGANVVDCHPILFLRMMDRVKAGAKLIVVDPRRTATAEKADLFLQIDARHRSGTAQRAATPGRRKRPHRSRFHFGVHRGLGGDAQFPGTVHSRRTSARLPASRPTTSARRPAGSAKPRTG